MLVLGPTVPVSILNINFSDFLGGIDFIRYPKKLKTKQSYTSLQT